MNEDINKEIVNMKRAMFGIAIAMAIAFTIFYYSEQSHLKTIQKNFDTNSNTDAEQSSVIAMLHQYEVQDWFSKSNLSDKNITCPIMELGKVRTLDVDHITVVNGIYSLIIFKDGNMQCQKSNRLVKCKDMCADIPPLNATKSIVKAQMPSA